MTVAIIGAGNVGGALARRFAEVGVAVRIGVREPARASELARETGAEATTPADAISGADVVFLTVPGSAAIDAAAALGDLGASILVDCTNPIRWDEGPVWAPPDEGSLAAAIAARTGARVVKGWNTFGAEFHRDPALGDRAADVLLASDDADALDVVSALATRAGFRPVPAGPLRNAAALENHAILWIHLALAAGHGRDWIFAMVDRQT